MTLKGVKTKLLKELPLPLDSVKGWGANNWRNGPRNHWLVRYSPQHYDEAIKPFLAPSEVVIGKTIDMAIKVHGYKIEKAKFDGRYEW